MNPGDVVADRFEIESEAGSGGMGTVYRALDRQTKSTIALKILHSQSSSDAERFAREVTILAELEHPHVVRYVGSGITTTGQRFLAMEWLEGDDLAVHLTRRGLTIAESLDVIRRAAEALGVAHRRGIVHRDLKPNNLFVPDGDITRLKVLDFGIARRTREHRGLTRTGVIIGTPEYMSPEQARGSKDVDARSDVFALGCVLFECITGRAAFVGDNLIAVLAKILLEEAPRLSELRTDIPPAVDALVARMLSKRPDGRQADGAMLAQEILALGEVHGHAAAPVSAPPAALTSNEQRMVSIVFAGGHQRHTDVMAATLNIEPQSALAPTLRELAEPFGARIETLADGSIIAMLSGSDAATDQASRVARCALALRPLLAEAPMVLVTGRGVISTRMPMGEVIDRAVRVLPLAKPGGVIRLDEATAGLLGSRFDVGGDGGGLFLRGERDDFEVVRTICGKETSFVGRDRELKSLDGIFEEAASEPVARAVLVTGAAGSGKSRLLQEFVKRVRARDEDAPEIFTARGDSLSAGSPFGMIAPAIRRAAGVLDGEPVEVQRKKIRSRVARHVPAADVQRISEFLGELASVSFTGDVSAALNAARTDAMLMGDGMRAAFEDWLMAESEAQPVLLVLEDLHWGDLPSVKFVDSALRVLRDRPFMVLAVARPEVHKQFPAVWAERELNEIKLGALTKKSAERLVREVLGDTASAETVTRLVERADGNAFYLEELIRAVGNGIAADKLPDSVLGMVQARLDALGNEARRVLRAASVFGQTFWRGGVMKLLGGDHRTTGVIEWLDELVAREVIAKSSSPTLPGETEYVFRNALVREATYAMLTEEDRVLGHRLAGSWLQQAGEPNALVLAQHFEQGKEPQRALECFARAAEQALEGNDIAEAVARAARAIALGATGHLLGKLELIRAEAHFFRGEHREAENCAVAAAAQFAPGDSDWFAAMTLATLPAGQQGHMERAEVRLRTMIAQPPVDAAGSAKVCALFQSGMQFMQAGRPELYDEMNTEFEKLRRETPDMTPRATAFMKLLRATPMYASDLATALRDLEAGLMGVEQASDARFAVTARSNVGYVASELGNYERSEEVLRAAIATAERMGAFHTANLALHNLGNVVGILGRLEEARGMELRAIEAFVKQSNPRLEGASRIYLSNILYRLGDAIGAEREARAAIEVLGKHPLLRPDAWSLLGRALLAQNRAPEALVAARKGVSEIENTANWRRMRALHNLVLAEAYEANGDREAACAALRVSQEMILSTGNKIGDAAARDRLFKRVPDNARVFELCAQWGVAE